MVKRLKALEAKGAQEDLMQTEATANWRVSSQAIAAPRIRLCRQPEGCRACLSADFCRHLRQDCLCQALRSRDEAFAARFPCDDHWSAAVGYGLKIGLFATDDAEFHQHVKPPSTFTIAPVMRLDASDARKRTALATSSGLPMRPIGVSFSQTGMRSR